MRALYLLILALSAGCHPWFKMGPGAPPDQQPEIVGPEGEIVCPPRWLVLLEDCRRLGGRLPDCIGALPPGERREYEHWLSERESRRALMKSGIP